MTDYLKAFKNILNITGRASRSEFWNFLVMHIIVNVAMLFIVNHFGLSDIFHNIYVAVTFLAFITVGFRRLNDAGYIKWLFLIPFVNLILALFPRKEEN